MLKQIIDNYLNIIKNKYTCFEGTATQQEFIHFIAVWFVGAFALGIISVIFALIGIGFIGNIICIIWNLANLVPGIGTLIRFLNSRKN